MAKECPKCGMPIPESAKICPHCKAKQPKKKGCATYIIWGIIILTAIIMASMGA